jgi:predicted outer membrane lipoprotein
VSIVVYVPLTERLLDKTKDEHFGREGKHERKRPWFATKVGVLWVCAFGSLGALAAEGAATNWGGVLLAENMKTERGITANVFLHRSRVPCSDQPLQG